MLDVHEKSRFEWVVVLMEYRLEKTLPCPRLSWRVWLSALWSTSLGILSLEWLSGTAQGVIQKASTEKVTVQQVCFFLIYLILERGEENEKEREWNFNVWLPLVPPVRDLTHNPGMCPDWELNQWSFGSQPPLNPLSHTSRGKFSKVLKEE